MKKKIFAIVLVLLLVLGSYLIYNFRNKEDDNKVKTKVNDVLSVVNLFEKMEIEEYVLDDFIFTSFNVFLNDGNDSLELIFMSDNAVEKVIFEVSLFDKDDELIESVDFVVDNLFLDEERSLFCYVDIDLVNVESFSIRIKND